MLKEYKIKELGDISTGNTPSKKNKEFYDSKDIMFIKPDDIDEDIKELSSSKEYISFIAKEKSRIIPKNTLLVTCIGSIGKIAINKEEGAFNQQINAIVPNNKIFSSKYLAYVFMNNKEKLKAIANAPVVPIINKTQFSEFKVYIHDDLGVQKKIVDILDKAQKLINKRKLQIEELDLLVKSKFIEMFGDPVKNQKKLAKVKLSELGEWKTGGTPLRSKSEYYNGNIPWLSSGELNNKYCFKSNEMITESAIIESAAKIIEVGSLLLGMYDTAALKSTINMIECSCNQAIAYSKLNENLVNTVYVYYCIQIGKEFYKSQQRGVRQKNLNLSMIKGLEILMPELELQNQFAEFVKRVDKLKFEMEKSLKELEDNFNSLMQKAFKGELFK
ncbi:restriction endonuclease subunit S [Clostridium perfringens]|uniref:Type I restriction enzyme S subunit n=1 Tax=Clostridium perfringens D str. JGS1721 TaxID=488537 RepID=B1V5G7_CLOPF|nr:restriction endonuclease subunit S [Clostridium perfringens]EDT70925.1 type I restriction enzyme S subunit [Clostridium perfringens D str. JGS1721]ELC8395544.1 restriction endonuclease subunit S [Clostridium perfringens]PWX10352.1 restriction endonuclease subunit S [Clostridium perfringens]STB60812.1 type I restriction-modification system subunit S [Clostridium perfringens]